MRTWLVVVVWLDLGGGRREEVEVRVAVAVADCKIVGLTKENSRLETRV